MSAFVSHSAKDGVVSQAIRAGLVAQKVPTWDPDSMASGGSVRDQLRCAIANCDVCIFLATQNSLKDEWCQAQLGAFWGAGKPVIVLITDTTVDVAQLPPPLQGDLTTTNFDKVIKDALKIIGEAARRRDEEKTRRTRKVSEMSVAVLYDALASLRSTAMDSLPVGEAMRLMRDNLAHDLADSENMLPLMSRLVGVPQVIIEESAFNYWPTSFTLATETGTWLGFAVELDRLRDVYSSCLMVYCDSKSLCAAAAAASAIWMQEGEVKYNGLIENPPHLGLCKMKQLLPSALLNDDPRPSS